MNAGRSFFPSIETQIDRADRMRRMRYALRHSAVLVAVVALGVLLVGAAAVGGWLTSTEQAAAVLLIGLVAAAVTWFAMLIVAWGSPLDREPLVRAIEASHGSLMDRLNTLEYLARRAPRSQFVEPIQVQAANELRRSAPPRPYPFRPIAAHLAVAACMLLLAQWYWNRYQPWQRLVAAEREASRQREEPAAPKLDIPGWDAESSPPGAAREWREIRFVRPGRDLRAASFEIIDLELEVVSSRPVTGTRWISSINGGSPSTHALPTPADSGYGVLEAELDLPALGARDWDVVLYYAEASIEGGIEAVSDLYFVEVIPLRARLAELPGGESGLAARLIDATWSKVERQLTLVRGAFDVARRADRDPAPSDPGAPAPSRGPDFDGAARPLGALAYSESALAEEARGLADAIDAELGEQGAPLAERWRRAAEKLAAIRDRVQQPGADATEAMRESLRELIDAHRQTESLVRDQTEWFAQWEREFGSGGADAGTSDPARTAEERRADTAEHHERLTRELEAIDRESSGFEEARKFVRETLHAQRTIQRDRDRQHTDLAEIARRQRGLHRSFEQQGDAMPAMRPVETPRNKAGAAMAIAADAAESRRPDASERLDEAGNALQELDQALLIQRAAAERRARNKLAEWAMRHARRLDSLAHEPDPLDRRTIPEAARDAKELGTRMEKRMPAGEPNAAAHSDRPANPAPPTKELESQAGRLADAAKSNDGAECRKAADGVCRALESMADALRNGAGSSLAARPGRSQPNREQANGPSSTNAAPTEARSAGSSAGGSSGSSSSGIPSEGAPSTGGNTATSTSAGEGARGTSLRESGHDAFARGLRELDSLARDGARSRRMTGEQRRELERDAASQFAEAIPNLFGHNARSQAIVERLNRDLNEPRDPVDNETIRALVAELDALRRESAAMGTERREPKERSQVDRARIPPEYRRAIERYFERLSREE
ncbi:MAG: hypothetical protein FJ297_00600 [Planctomycetes bacterium]|nr:hypothetical protein [Planctomycetota bacterium]